MQHFSEIPNYPAPIPPPIRNRRSFAGFWSRSMCLFLASSSARPAAALRDKEEHDVGRIFVLVDMYRAYERDRSEHDEQTSSTREDRDRDSLHGLAESNTWAALE